MKPKPLSECKSTKDFAGFLNANGYPVARVSGGHEIHRGPNGSIPLSTHEKEPSKHLRGQLVREIKKLLGIVALLVLGGSWFWVFFVGQP